MKIGKSYSLGDITDSILWISIERKPFAYWRWQLSFGPTYVGTFAGLVVSTPCFVVIAHLRNIDR